MTDDLISRQAAIKAIEDLQDCYNGFSDTYDKACIIGVLEEIPTAQVNTPTDTPTDTISRQAAIDAVGADVIERDRPPVEVKYWNMGLERASIILGNLPSAQRTGRWIKHEVKLFNGRHTGRYFDECSECGKLTTEWRKVTEYHRWNFCPNCGARMEEQE